MQLQPRLSPNNHSGLIALGDGTKARHDQAIAVGKNSVASGDRSLAIGSTAQASGSSAISIGTSTEAKNTGSVAVGNKAKSKGIDDTALGAQSHAIGGYSTAVGTRAYTGADGAVALGTSAAGKGQRATAVGSSSYAGGMTGTAVGYHAITTDDARHSTALGTGTVVSGIDSGGWSAAVHGNPSAFNNANRSYIGGTGNYAIGNKNVVGNLTTNSVAFGNNIKLGADGATLNSVNSGSTGESRREGVTYTAAKKLENAVAIGNESGVSGDNGVATGYKAVASGVNATASGSGAQATAENATASGSGAQATEKNAAASGSGAKAEAENATAMGSEANASESGGVALGAKSTADRAARALGAAADETATAANGKVYAMPDADAADAAASATVKGDLGAVSVGDAGNTRQIINVAAGSEDSDAVNVAQLKAVAKKANGTTIHNHSHVTRVTQVVNNTKVSAGKNIQVRKNGDDYNVALADDITLNSVTTGDRA